MFRRVFREKNYLGFAGKRFHVGRVNQAARPHIALDDLVKVLLEERNVALRHLHHLGTVRVAAGDRGAEISQAGRNDRTKVSRTVYPDLHIPPKERTRSPEHRRGGRTESVRTTVLTLYVPLHSGIGNAREAYVLKDASCSAFREERWGVLLARC